MEMIEAFLCEADRKCKYMVSHVIQELRFSEYGISEDKKAIDVEGVIKGDAKYGGGVYE